MKKILECYYQEDKILQISSWDLRERCSISSKYPASCESLRLTLDYRQHFLGVDRIERDEERGEHSEDRPSEREAARLVLLVHSEVKSSDNRETAAYGAGIRKLVAI